MTVFDELERIAFGFERFHPSPTGLTARVTASMRGWPRSEFLRICPIFEFKPDLLTRMGMPWRDVTPKLS